MIDWTNYLHYDPSRPHQIGITPDGHPVCGGAFVFWMMDTHGTPLVFILDYFQKRSWVVDWLGLILTATGAGWRQETIMARISEATFEVYGRDHQKEVILRLSAWLGV